MGLRQQDDSLSAHLNYLQDEVKNPQPAYSLLAAHVEYYVPARSLSVCLQSE